MQYDVKALRLQASAAVTDARVRAKGIYIVHGAAAGSVQLRDGGAAGTVKAEFDTPAVAGHVWLEFPGEGVLFETSLYATLTTVTSVTVFYG